MIHFSLSKGYAGSIHMKRGATNCSYHLQILLIFLPYKELKPRGEKMLKKTVFFILLIATGLASCQSKAFIWQLLGTLLDGATTTKYTDLPLFHNAIKKGDIKRAKQLMEFEEIDINKPDQYGNTPIHYCLCSKKKLKVLKFLLKNEADINAQGEHGETLLHKAVKKANRELVEFLINNGAGESINKQNSKGHSVLHVACNNKQVDTTIIKHLIQSGAHIGMEDKNRHTPLQTLCKNANSNLESIQLLVNSGATINKKSKHEKSTPLALACKYKQLPIIKFLIESSAEVNSYCLINICKREDICIELIDYIIKQAINQGYSDIVNAIDENKKTPLIYSCQNLNTNVNIITYLIKSGADTNIKSANKNTPLIYALKNKQLGLDAIKTLVEHANHEIINEEGFLYEKPLDIAIKYSCHLEIVAYLINKGAKPGIYSLCYACQSPDASLEMIKLLVENGAPINEKDANGNTPLHYALKKEIIQYLVEKELDINIQNYNNETPLHCACRRKEISLDIIKCFIESGADIKIKNRYEKTPIYYLLKRNPNNEKIQKIVDYLKELTV